MIDKNSNKREIADLQRFLSEAQKGYGPFHDLSLMITAPSSSALLGRSCFQPSYRRCG
jgi:hypothetical protein